MLDDRKAEPGATEIPGAAGIHAMKLQLARRRGRLESLTAKLSQLSPLRILERGYAIVTSDAGQILKSAAAAPPGSNIRVRLAEGRLQAEVTSAEQ